MNDIKVLKLSKRKALGRRTERSLNDRVNNTAKNNEHQNNISTDESHYIITPIL